MSGNDDLLGGELFESELREDEGVDEESELSDPLHDDDESFSDDDLDLGDEDEEEMAYDSGYNHDEWN